MASSMYDQLLSVLRHPPDCRLHFQLDHLLPWFKKNVSLFRNMKSETLNDLIKNARFVTKERDDVIIRQGDIGDCMYILLRGQVTVFIQYAKNEGDDRTPNAPVPAMTNKSEMLRHQLGTFVTHIGPGVQFGEVALLSDQVRTASIVTDERSELIMIDRELYNRSVRDVLQHEFDLKVRFIEENQYFQKMAPRFRKQLAMALQKRTIPYEGILMRQGDPADAIYFTISGELKVTTDPNLHPAQFPKLLTDSINSSVSIQHVKPHTVEDVKKTNSRRDSTTHQQRKTPLEVCLIGINKPIGDMEVLMGMKTYMQTVSGAQATDLLQLEHKHYDRLFLRRNAAVVDGLLFDIELCLQTRTAALQARRERVPLFDALLTIVGRQTSVIRRRQQQRAGSTSSAEDGDRRRGSYVRQRNGSKADAARATNGNRRASAPVVVHRASPSKPLSVAAQSPTSLSLPPSNVDDGSSSYVTQRTARRVTLANVGGAENYDEQQQQQQQGRRIVMATHLPEEYVVDAGQIQVLATPRLGDQQQTGLHSQRESQRFVTTCAGDYVPDDTTNVQLDLQQSTAIDACNNSVNEAKNIESRLRSWLTDFGRDHPVARSSMSPVSPSMDAQRFDVVPSSTLEPRIITLKRCQTPVEGVRPGTKVVFRSKHRDVMITGREDIDAGELMKLNYGNSLSNTRLEYYKLALTADVPFTPRDVPTEYV